MVKIKDDVDLKELEKYGFEYDEYMDCYVKPIFSNKTRGMYVPFVHTGELFIYKDLSWKSVVSNKYWGVDLEHKEAVEKVFNDLINADLAEKVEE